MYLRSPFYYETKSIFYYFLAISCILHLIFIFTSASFSQIFKTSLNFVDDSSSKDNYVVEVSFETIKEEDDEEDKSPELKKEEEITQELKEEEKREVFVDTSEKVTDETAQTDTEKIGEVGSIAKDMYEGEENMNNEPRLTGEGLVMDPEYRTALAPQQEEVQVEPLINTLPLIEEKIENSVPEKELSEETGEGVTVETPEETEERRDVAEMDENDPIKNVENVEEKSVENATEEGVTADQNEVVKFETSLFDSDVVVPVTIPVQENTKEERNPDEETAEIDGKEVNEEQEEQEVLEPLPDLEHTKLASIPKDIMDQIIKDPQKGEKESIQENEVSPQEQLNAVPPSDNVQAPFFEDDISNAPIQGSESFNIKKHEYAPYYKHIRDKIRLFWLVQYGTDASINLVTKDYKPVVVEFKVLPSGKIVQVVISNTAGNDLLASKVQASVQNTMLNKFPDYVNEKFINVRFNFYFF